MKQVQLLSANHTSLLEFSISLEERRAASNSGIISSATLAVPPAVRKYRAAARRRFSRLGATTYLYKLHNFTYD